MRGFQAILFDFDYTLADSSRGVIDCVGSALQQLGLSSASDEAVCRTIGLSLGDTLVQLAGPEHAHLRDAFVRLFVQRADQVMSDKTVLFGSVPEAVRLLKDKGMALGIVSTKFRYRIETVLKRERVLDLFDVIVGGEDVTRHKPDPESLHLAMEKLNAPGDVLYVGDSLTDAEAARRASVPFVAVLSGVTPGDAFHGHEPLAIVQDLPDLVDWLAG
ncbi:MAG: HAD-IA family hydrolase [Anaerolineae bacterium]|nr:HAD-IA family hydrolase [Anaerolineae bacterium]